MAGSILKLTIDRQARKITSFRGTVGAMPDCFQSNTLSLQVQVVDPPTDILAQPSIVDLAGFGLRASVGATPTGTAGGPAPLALQDTFVWDAVNKWFTADLALNTGAIDAFIGALASIPAYFELNITSSGNRITILQTTFNLRAVVDELTSNVPTPGNVYLTLAESIAYFFPIVGKPGMTLTFVSPDGTKKREIGVNNDGSGIDNFIQ
jgi:hypothetical protein